MKLILAQPATSRFQWELDVLLANIRQFTDAEVVLLFTEHDFTVPMHFRSAGCSVFVYQDTRDDMGYIPSVRPWLLWQYFEQNPAEQNELYFYIDSDIIFREWIDCATLDLTGEKVYGATCDGYIGLSYILGVKRGEEIAQKMADVCGITVEQMKNVPGIGAQLLLPKNSAEFWKRCYFDSNKLYHYFEELGETSNIQKWTAEMWAQQWGWVREGKTLIHETQLDFCLPTDPVERYDEVKILHNAGITQQMSFEYFFKGQYDKTSPLGKNFDFVRKDKATIRYVEAVQKVIQ